MIAIFILRNILSPNLGVLVNSFTIPTQQLKWTKKIVVKLRTHFLRFFNGVDAHKRRIEFRLKNRGIRVPTNRRTRCARLLRHCLSRVPWKPFLVEHFLNVFYTNYSVTYRVEFFRKFFDCLRILSKHA